MLLQIFIKTGEYRDREGGYDGDDGYFDSVLVPYEKIDAVLTEMVYDDYFRGHDIAKEDIAKVKVCLRKFISELDMDIYERYREQLEEYFTENPEEI